jgi:hypothetical protein
LKQPLRQRLPLPHLPPHLPPHLHPLLLHRHRRRLQKHQRSKRNLGEQNGTGDGAVFFCE